MTKQDLLKYAGKKTFGKNNSLLTNGVIVGFDANDDNECLVARFENGDVQNCGWSSTPYNIEFFTEEELQIYNSGKGCYLFARIDNVIMGEQKELDLTEILKGCEGIELWSNVFGLCKLERIVKQARHPIVLSITNNVGVNISECISKEGLYNNGYNGECILWPSETNRDWSPFKKPIKDDDWVVACDGEGCGHINKYCNINRTWKYVIPFERYNPTLQEEELKKLSIV